jgi:hypothetical protein
MKDYEIKRFKRFLKENGVLKSFYRHFNPDFFNSYYLGEKDEKITKIEDYLKKIKNYQVFLYAFNWKDAANMDNINDEKFWKNIEEKYLHEFALSYYNGRS